MGDGSYVFANPAACHKVIGAHSLPVIAVMLKTGEFHNIGRGQPCPDRNGYRGRGSAGRTTGSIRVTTAEPRQVLLTTAIAPAE
jgi:acetolactate synthase-1/2/3 large subunit